MCGLLHTRTIKDVSGPWKMTMCVIDSDYDTDVDTRRSRAGFVIYLNSEQEPHHIQQYTVTQRGQDLEKKHPDLNLSKTVMDDEPMSSMVTATCGTEYMTLSLTVKELIWIYMLLKTIGVNGCEE